MTSAILTANPNHFLVQVERICVALEAEQTTLRTERGALRAERDALLDEAVQARERAALD